MCGVLDMPKKQYVPLNRELRIFPNGMNDNPAPRRRLARSLSLGGPFPPTEESASRDIARFREGPVSKLFGPTF
jgi:hypothetical protein